MSSTKQVVGFVAMEFYGTGDPYFGGTADDRLLGKSGAFLTGVYLYDRDVAVFATREEALAAAAVATNRRKGGKVSALVERRRADDCVYCDGTAVPASGSDWVVAHTQEVA